MTFRRLLIAGLLPALVSLSGIAQEKTHYRPTLTVPETMAPFLKHLEPGSDAFTLEGYVKDLEARLRDLSDAFRGGPARLAGATSGLFAPSFRDRKSVV